MAYAIQCAGGPSLADECRRYVTNYGPVGVATAKCLTSSGNMPCQQVITRVGLCMQNIKFGSKFRFDSASIHKSVMIKHFPVPIEDRVFCYYSRRLASTAVNISMGVFSLYKTKFPNTPTVKKVCVCV